MVLRVALAALQIGSGDEVITQSFTFVATVESIIEAGATPVCTEVDQFILRNDRIRNGFFNGIFS